MLFVLSALCYSLLKKKHIFILVQQHDPFTDNAEQPPAQMHCPD